MHDRTPIRALRTVPAFLGLAALALGGCAHNDVLVFGTSTTIGLNVETVSAEGAPSIVLGYEREEAVWMPLMANGRDSRVATCNVAADRSCVPAGGQHPYPLDQAMYQSTETRDGTVVRRDTYSVFASLGAKFNANASSGNGAGASGGLAQFFATGNAALNISGNEALVTALKVESGQGAEAQARAVEAAANQTPAVAEILRATGATMDRLEACARGADSGWHWSEILDAIPDDAISAGDMRYLSRLTAADMRTRLQSNQRLSGIALSAAESTPLC